MTDDINIEEEEGTGPLKAPFPYFGGKSIIAHLVWDALGNPRQYIEPFFGSGAVLLNRPHYNCTVSHEIVNDKDGFIANVWRGLQFAPDAVAKWCDWPVNHADLIARKARLIREENYLLENLCKDDKWCDPELAGYWIWAAGCWIGGGLTRPGQRPNLANGGKGVHAIGQIPHLADGGMGVHAIGKIPHLTQGGMGVHAIGQIPHLTQGGKGVQDVYNENIYKRFRQLSERLRNVRVVCGDWTRVCGGDWQDKIGDVGMFFDPPYGVEDRNTSIYHHDSTTIAADVMAWCKARGSRPEYKIVLAGYEEYEELQNFGWRKLSWKAQGGYSRLGKGKKNENNKRETLWFSPYCIPEKQLSLF